MEIKTLYRYGHTTVAPIKPDDGTPYTTAYRLIADPGKALTQDGVHLAPCIDVDTPDGWYEVDAPGDEYTDPDAATEVDYQSALRDMGVEL